MIDILRGTLGMLVLLAIAWLFSSNRKKIPWRLVGIGVGLQLTFGVLVLKVDFIYDFFRLIGSFFVRILEFTDAGTQFVFGSLVSEEMMDTFGVIFAFKILPTIIFFAALTSALYHLGLLQKLVKGIAWLMTRTMGLSGAEALSAAGNIFIGQTEAPLLVQPYIGNMTRSELMCIMTGGMATLAGSVLSAFIFFLGGTDPAQQEFYATHLLSASVMSAPAAIVMAKIMLPEEKPELLDRSLKLSTGQQHSNLLDALAGGASEGLKLALNVAAMLIAFLAAVAMVNAVLTDLIGDPLGLNDWVKEVTGGQFKAFSLEFLFGQLFRPLAWLIGIEWADTLQVGSLLGQKTAINEFVAYNNLGKLPPGTISEKSKVISTYALAGFANFASIAIQIGGIGAMAPKRRGDLARLGLPALVGGTLACMMTAAIAGMLIT